MKERTGCLSFPQRFSLAEPKNALPSRKDRKGLWTSEVRQPPSRRELGRSTNRKVKLGLVRISAACRLRFHQQLVISRRMLLKCCRAGSDQGKRGGVLGVGGKTSGSCEAPGKVTGLKLPSEHRRTKQKANGKKHHSSQERMQHPPALKAEAREEQRHLGSWRGQERKSRSSRIWCNLHPYQKSREWKQSPSGKEDKRCHLQTKLGNQSNYNNRSLRLLRSGLGALGTREFRRGGGGKKYKKKPSLSLRSEQEIRVGKGREVVHDWHRGTSPLL